MVEKLTSFGLFFQYHFLVALNKSKCCSEDHRYTIDPNMSIQEDEISNNMVIEIGNTTREIPILFCSSRCRKRYNNSNTNQIAHNIFIVLYTDLIYYRSTIGLVLFDKRHIEQSVMFRQWHWIYHKSNMADVNQFLFGCWDDKSIVCVKEVVVKESLNLNKLF